jgi:hypothetical protein
MRVSPGPLNLVFSMLPFPQCVQVRLVCKRWKQVTNNHKVIHWMAHEWWYIMEEYIDDVLGIEMRMVRMTSEIIYRRLESFGDEKMFHPVDLVRLTDIMVRATESTSKDFKDYITHFPRRPKTCKIVTTEDVTGLGRDITQLCIHMKKMMMISRSEAYQGYLSILNQLCDTRAEILQQRFNLAEQIYNTSHIDTNTAERKAHYFDIVMDIIRVTNALVSNHRYDRMRKFVQMIIDWLDMTFIKEENIPLKRKFITDSTTSSSSSTSSDFKRQRQRQ